MPHISPNRRRSIAVLGHGPISSKATQKRRRAYSIAPGEKLSPAARARTLVPRKSILKGSVSARPSQESIATEDTGSNNVTMTMDFTEVVRTAAAPRKSLARRVSFASHAHVRLFEKQDPNTSGDISKSESEGDEEDGEEDPVELDFLHEDDAPRRPPRRRSSTGFSELGEQSMSMDMDADDTGPIPQDFLDGPALGDEQFDEDAYEDDMDMTAAIPGSIRPRPSLGIETLGTPNRRRSSSTTVVTSSQSQSENQVSRRPLGLISKASEAEPQQRLYPSLEDVPDPSPSRALSQSDPDVSAVGDLSDMDLTVGSAVEPTISSSGDENTQPMEFTIPVVRPPPPPSDLWLNLRAMTHAGAEQPYVPPDMEASDDPEANAIVSKDDHHEGSSPSRGDGEDHDSMDLTVALSRLAQARPSLGLPALSEDFTAGGHDEGDDEADTSARQDESFSTNDDTMEADMSFDGNQTVNLTTLRLSLEGRTQAADASMEFTNVYGQQLRSVVATTPPEQQAEPAPVSSAQEGQPGLQQVSHRQESGQDKENERNPPPPKLPIFTLTQSQSSAPPPQAAAETQQSFRPSIPLPIFTLAPTAQNPPQISTESRSPQSPDKAPTGTTVPAPFTFSVPSRSRTSPTKASSATTSKIPTAASPKKLPIFRGTAAFAPPSTGKSPLKRPAPTGEGERHTSSPAKRQAIESQTAPNKPQAIPANENAPQNRRISAVRRPSGYFAQRKSLGSAGAPLSVGTPNLAKSTSATSSLEASSQQQSDVSAPPPFRFEVARDESPLATTRPREPQSAVGHQAPSPHDAAPPYTSDNHLQEVSPPPSSSSPASTSPSAPNRSASAESASVPAPLANSSPALQPPEEEHFAPQSSNDIEEPDQEDIDEEDMDMTNRWRDGLADGGMLDEDEPTISIEQFFEMTNIRFMDEITAPRRSMIHPGHLGMRNRRRSLTSSHAEETEQIPLAEFMVALAVDIPELELYHDLSGQLSAWVEESKKICRQAEEDAIKVTPALFREFAEADELEKQDLVHQLKLIKANTIDRAKSQWYEWKATWVEQLQESAEQAFAELESDAKTLEGIISQAQSHLPSLREEYAKIMAELEKEEAAVAEIENSDKNFLSDLKVSIAEQDVEVQALQANVSEAQAKLNRLQERDAEIRQEKEELEAAIARGQELVQRQTESTSLKVFRLKEELESLEDLHLWRAVKLDANLKEFIYASRIKVSIPCVAHHPDATLLQVERTKSSRTKERDEFPELSELMLVSAPHVVAASHKEPDLRTIVQRLSDLWTSCGQIRLQLTFLAVQYPLELQLLPGDNGLPTFQVSAKVLFPSAKSKANIIFIFDSDTYSRWPLSIGLLKCDVQVAYGRADRQQILEAVQSRLAQATSSENHGCLLDACIEATERLAFA